MSSIKFVEPGNAVDLVFPPEATTATLAELLTYNNVALPSEDDEDGGTAKVYRTPQNVLSLDTIIGCDESMIILGTVPSTNG